MTFDLTAVEPFDRAPHMDVNGIATDIYTRWRQCVANSLTTKSLADFTNSSIKGVASNAFGIRLFYLWQSRVINHGYEGSLVDFNRVVFNSRWDLAEIGIEVIRRRAPGLTPAKPSYSVVRRGPSLHHHPEDWAPQDVDPEAPNLGDDRWRHETC